MTVSCESYNIEQILHKKGQWIELNNIATLFNLITLSDTTIYQTALRINTGEFTSYKSN